MYSVTDWPKMPLSHCLKHQPINIEQNKLLCLRQYQRHDIQTCKRYKCNPSHWTYFIEN